MVGLHCCGMEHRRLCGLRRVEVCDTEVPVATGLRARLLGLAFLDREVVGNGLLITHCGAIHSFGMRFELRVVFLGLRGEIVREACVKPRRFAACRGAVAVLELPSPGVYRLPSAGNLTEDPKRRNEMSLIDKLTGRAKKAAGDLTGDSSIRREGRNEERKGEAKEDLADAQDRADDKADEVADLERKT